MILQIQRLLIQRAKKSVRIVKDSFSDIKVTINKIIAEGDTVFALFTFQANFKQNGKDVESQTMSLFKFKDGKIVEAWSVFDKADLYKRIGISLPSSMN